jgi:tRNA-Thr(GGU) m(6)t(6)A37 methyltransferase TsaA
MDGTICFRQIGTIHSEHVVPEKTPAQSVFAKGCLGRVEVFPEFAEGLKDIEGFSHLYLIYQLHRAGPLKLVVMPLLQDLPHGVFATRAAARPNPIGLSIVELVKREQNILHIDGVDILDGTPLLDIKPYTARFDRFETSRNGWQDQVDDKAAWRRGRREYTGA